MESKSPVETRIIDRALEMFNESGIEYVGMRELASALDIRIGNLTYYFPTKDDLVNRLSLDLADENNKTIVVIENMTITSFFEMLEHVFQNHYRYRCLMLSFVHLIQRNPLIAKRYSKTQAERNATWKKNIQALVSSKYIAVDKAEADFLVSTIALIARFWISESVISYAHLTEDQQREHYLKMIARIFLPYATAKGRRELESY